MLRTLAYPIACALTGAASGLLVAQLATPPAPTCPQGPVLELRQVATALSGMEVVPPPAPAAAPQDVSAGLAIPDGAIRCPAEDHCVIRRDLFSALFENPVRLTRQARVMPSIRDGVTLGFKFYGIKPGSLPRLIGMKNGDLLTAINGVEVRSFDQLLDQVVRLRIVRSFDLDIERKGEPVRLRVDVE